MEKILLITDPGIDTDDVVNALFIAKLIKKGDIKLIGAIANLDPAEKRAQLLKGVFNSLGVEVPVAVGSDCNYSRKVEDYEFDFALADEDSVICHPWFIDEILAKQKEDKSVTLLLTSGLTDIRLAIQRSPMLLKRKLKQCYIMGGGSFNCLTTNVVNTSYQEVNFVADRTASNNRFDKTFDSQEVYDFFIEAGIALKVLTRNAAYAIPVKVDFYDELAEKCGAVGQYLRRVQKSAITGLWKHSNENDQSDRQNRKWFCQTFCGCDDLPITKNESPWEYVKGFALYDPLTTFWMLHPNMFSPVTEFLGSLDTPCHLLGLSKEENGIKPGTEQDILHILKQILVS